MSSGWKEATFYIRVALVISCLGFLIFLIGFSSDDWMQEPDEGKYGMRRIFGLFKMKSIITYRNTYELSGRLNQPGENPSKILKSGWFRATQAVECLGLILLAIAVIFLFMYFFVPSFKQKNVLLGIVALTFVSVIFIIIGVSIFGTKLSDFGYSVGWSMGLAITGAVLAFIAGIMEVLELRSLMYT